MGKRPRVGLSAAPRATVLFALVLGATSVHAQIPFGLEDASREALPDSGFVTHRLRAMAADESDTLDGTPLRHRGDLHGRAFLRWTDEDRPERPAAQPVDYEALSTGIAAEVASRSQVMRGFEWLRDEGAAEQGAGNVVQIFRAQGYVRGSLLASLGAAGVPNAAATEAVRAFEQEIDLPRDVRGGDRFAVLVERSFAANGKRIGEDRIVWAELRLYGQRALSIHRFRPERGTEQFWLADGLSVAKAPLRAPMDESLLSSPFGKREGPILGKQDAMHTGVDYAVALGTPVPAAAAGIVKAAEPNAGYGNWVVIEHGPGLATAYAHLESFAPGIETGAKVSQGDIIGFSGTTGFSTGPHLHYEVHVDGEAVDPLTHSAAVRNMLRGTDLERFHAEIGRLLQDYAGTAPIARLSIR